MFYHLLYPLHEYWSFLNLFRYITVRAALAYFIAFGLVLFLGPKVIRYLKELGARQQIRKEGYEKLYQLQKGKQQTPTMGGVLILFAVTAATLLCVDWTQHRVLWALLVMVGLGAIGFADDYLKMTRKNAKGLPGTLKLLGQITLGVILGIYLFTDLNFSTTSEVPFLKNLTIQWGIWYIPFTALVITGSSNAVNLTDGLDGLAIGCLILVGVAFALMSYISGHFNFSDYLGVSYIRGGGELAIFCSALVGAGMGFLWFNTYPAAIFMGDTGALGLGGAVGVVALMIKKELLLVLVGGVFVMEAVSVILQTGSYRLRGKRVFRMAPIHHHFQLGGWSEPQVIVRFWIIGSLLTLLCLATLKLR